MKNLSGTNLGKFKKENYLDDMASRESLKAFFVWRLCVPNLQARKSTDITQILRWLMLQVGTKNLSQLQCQILPEMGAGYLKQYWNAGYGSRKPKLMTIANVIAILKSVSQMELLKDGEGLGSILLALDMHEMLGRLASHWRSKKSLQPSNEEEWEKVWKFAYDEADSIWARRSGWHQKYIQLALDSKAKITDSPECIVVFEEESLNLKPSYVVGQKVLGSAVVVIRTTKENE
jgi:hypothetical protein